MSKGIVSILGGLEAVSEFLKEQQKEEEEFSQYVGNDASSCIKEKRHHHVHTEDDSITKQWRGY